MCIMFQLLLMPMRLLLVLRLYQTYPLQKCAYAFHVFVFWVLRISFIRLLCVYQLHDSYQTHMTQHQQTSNTTRTKQNDSKSTRYVRFLLHFYVSPLGYSVFPGVCMHAREYVYQRVCISHVSRFLSLAGITNIAE